MTEQELREKLSNLMTDLIVDVSLKKLQKYDGNIVEKGRQYIASHNERLKLMMQLITQYGDTREREGKDSGYQTHISKQDHPRLEAKGIEIWGINIAYQGRSIYGDIAGSKAKAEEKLRLELERLAELKEEV